MSGSERRKKRKRRKAMETDAFRHAGDSEFGPLTCPACGCLFMGDAAYIAHVIKAHGVKLYNKNGGLVGYGIGREGETID